MENVPNGHLIREFLKIANHTVLFLNQKGNDWYITVVANIVCLSFFIGTSNGTEGALLIVNGLISWFGFVIMRMPQIPEYYKTLSLIKIEELSKEK